VLHRRLAPAADHRAEDDADTDADRDAERDGIEQHADHDTDAGAKRDANAHTLSKAIAVRFVMVRTVLHYFAPLLGYEPGVTPAQAASARRISACSIGTL
jgi:hypothetical protein